MQNRVRFIAFALSSTFTIINQSFIPLASQAAEEVIKRETSNDGTQTTEVQPAAQNKGIFDDIIRHIPIPKLPGGVDNDIRQQISKEAIKSIGRAFNDTLPVRLEADKSYKQANVKNFQPRTLELDAQTLAQPMKPGDYQVPVWVFCTRDSFHMPGKGVGYALAPLQGKHADAVNTLLNRGVQQGVERNTLQTLSWSIQASVPLQEMPEEHQALIAQLIPEYQDELAQGWLTRFEGRYAALAGQFRLPALDSFLGQLGEVGKIITQARHSRHIIRENALNYQRLEQQLVNGTLTADEESPWAELRPGVYARLVIEENIHGRNWFQFRVTTEGLENSEDYQGKAIVVAIPIIEFLLGRAVVAGAGRVITGGILAGIIAYPIGKRAQTLIPVLMLPAQVLNIIAMSSTGNGGGGGGGGNQRPPRKICQTAIKILTEYERLAEKVGSKIGSNRLAELNRLRDAGQITINHLPGNLRQKFPGQFNNMTLEQIRNLCGT